MSVARILTSLSYGDARGAAFDFSGVPARTHEPAGRDLLPAR